MSEEATEKRGRKKGKPAPQDAEAIAFSRCLRALEGLPPKAAARTLRHLQERYDESMDNQREHSSNHTRPCNAVPLRPVNSEVLTQEQ